MNLALEVNIESAFQFLFKTPLNAVIRSKVEHIINIIADVELVRGLLWVGEDKESRIAFHQSEIQFVGQIIKTSICLVLPCKRSAIT